MTKRREIPLFATRRTEGVRRKKPGRFVRNDGWGGAVLKLPPPKELESEQKRPPRSAAATFEALRARPSAAPERRRSPD